MKRGAEKRNDVVKSGAEKRKNSSVESSRDTQAFIVEVDKAAQSVETVRVVLTAE